VQTWSCDGRPAQKWRLARDGSGNRRLVNVLDGLCLDAAGPPTFRGGQKVQGWTCNGSPAQTWSWQ
jgi:Ricin-type beta-trefoil lectin domain